MIIGGSGLRFASIPRSAGDSHLLGVVRPSNSVSSAGRRLPRVAIDALIGINEGAMTQLEFTDEIARDSWSRAMTGMAPQWRNLWLQSLDSSSSDQELLRILGQVIAAHNEGELDKRGAARGLKPLHSHPTATSWPDGELAAIADLGDQILATPEVEAASELPWLWSEIEACYRRSILSRASDAGDVQRRSLHSPTQ